jgi:hypothetical protein
MDLSSNYKYFDNEKLINILNDNMSLMALNAYDIYTLSHHFFT